MGECECCSARLCAVGVSCLLCSALLPLPPPTRAARGPGRHRWRTSRQLGAGIHWGVAPWLSWLGHAAGKTNPAFMLAKCRKSCDACEATAAASAA